MAFAGYLDPAVCFMKLPGEIPNRQVFFFTLKWLQAIWKGSLDLEKLGYKGTNLFNK